MSSYQYIDYLMLQCQQYKARVAELEGHLSRIETIATEELERIEQHGGTARFAQRVQAIAKEAS